MVNKDCSGGLAPLELDFFFQILIQIEQLWSYMEPLLEMNTYLYSEKRDEGFFTLSSNITFKKYFDLHQIKKKKEDDGFSILPDNMII